MGTHIHYTLRVWSENVLILSETLLGYEYK